MFDFYFRGNSCPEAALDSWLWVSGCCFRIGHPTRSKRARQLWTGPGSCCAAPWEAPPLLLLRRFQIHQKCSTPHLMQGSGLHSHGGQTWQQPRLLWAPVLNGLLEDTAEFSKQIFRLPSWRCCCTLGSGSNRSWRRYFLTENRSLYQAFLTGQVLSLTVHT